MAQEKKYYWLKLHKDFFQSHKIRILEGLPNGKEYGYFLLKLMAESISHDGMLRLSDSIPYSPETLAALTNTNVDIVRNAISVFEQLGMLEILDNGTFFMTEVQKMTGSETAWAEKKRLYRESLKNQKQLEDKERTDRGQERTMSDKSIEIRDKSIDINNIYSPVSQEKTEHYASEIFEVISYLNEKTGCRYRESNKKNQSLIKARLNEGFTVDDFKKVIDNKVAEWVNDPKMNQYLRPVTLFGTKFESYLNQKPVVEERVMSKENADFLAAIMDD